MKGAARPDAGFKTFARWITGAVLIAAVGLSWPSGANAFLITQTGTSGGEPSGLPVFDVSGLVVFDSFSVSWANLLAGVDATGTVTVDALSMTSATISVSIDNLSPDTGGGEPRITVFGLSIDGYSSIDTTNSTAGLLLDKFDGSGGFPGFGDVVACVTANTCMNGTNGGIDADGGTDSFILVVSGMFGSSLTLDAFAIKIQGGPLDGDENDSYQLPGVPSVVPVPAALPLFLSALAGLGLIGWRRNRAAA